MKKLTLILLATFVLAACNKTNSVTPHSPRTKRIVAINPGQVYTNDYTYDGSERLHSWHQDQFLIFYKYGSNTVSWKGFLDGTKGNMHLNAQGLVDTGVETLKGFTGLTSRTFRHTYDADGHLQETRYYQAGSNGNVTTTINQYGYVNGNLTSEVRYTNGQLEQNKVYIPDYDVPNTMGGEYTGTAYWGKQSTHPVKYTLENGDTTAVYTYHVNSKNLIDTVNLELPSGPYFYKFIYEYY